MNPNAFEILKCYGLPLPHEFTLDEICESLSGEFFYLRFAKECGVRNRVLSGAECVSQRHILEDKIKSGELLKIEATYKFICGGVSLVKPDFSYTEYVEGHLCALLQYGLCGGRVLMSNREIHIHPLFQGWKVEQDVKNRHRFTLNGKAQEDKLNETALTIRRMLPIGHPGLLLEWFRSPNGIVFCDARDSGFEDFGYFLSDLINEPCFISLKSAHSPPSGRVFCDGFDVTSRHEPKAGDQILAINGALLSHFVMRNINKDIYITLGVKDYG